MITPQYVQCMAAYNAEMNKRLYAAAGRLSDEERRRDRGAFFGSIHRTFNHLLWADLMWLSRFDAGPKPPVPGAESTTMVADFGDLTRRRVDMDGRIESWATGVSEAWLQDHLTWFSGGSNQEMTKPRALLVMHVFNHQTHHRGQVHAMLTAAGQTTGDTDLPWIVDSY